METFYVIKKGDTLSKIARDVLGNINYWQRIAFLNQIKPPYTIFPGETITLPATDGTTQTPRPIITSTVPIIPPAGVLPSPIRVGFFQNIFKNPLMLGVLAIGIIALMSMDKGK